MKTSTILLLGAGGLGLLWYMNNNGSLTAAAAATQSTTPTADNPQGLVGINSGVLGGNGSFYQCANYAALLAAIPELGNVNHVFTPAEATQYFANYTDLQQGLASWAGGLSVHNAQYHWNKYGCAEKRIFVPLVPPSTAAYIPAPKSTSSGSSWISTSLQVAGAVAAILGTNNYNLTDGDVQCLITGAAVFNDILPFYQKNQPAKVQSATNRLNSLLTEYV